MSRLDSFIRRLEAQRAALGWAAARIAETAGAVFELGLGNGRTYDHLRSLLPQRDIFAFDIALKCHPDCRPDADHLILGPIETTLPAAATRFAGRIALVHSDLGDGTAAYGRRIAETVAEALAGRLAPGGLLLSDQRIAHPGFRAIALPDLPDPERYFGYEEA